MSLCSASRSSLMVALCLDSMVFALFFTASMISTECFSISFTRIPSNLDEAVARAVLVDFRSSCVLDSSCSYFALTSFIVNSCEDFRDKIALS